MIVCKFGGTSLADASQIKKVASILAANPDRRYVVVSAPGKRFPDDIKVTDLLFECWHLAHMRRDYSDVLAKVEARFADIIAELGIDFDLAAEISAIRAVLTVMPHQDYMTSRGEYLSAKIMALYLGVPFIDPARYIRFADSGKFDLDQTVSDLRSALKDVPRAVIAGFYGSRPDGSIRTFSRGGSDITGAIAAAAAGADLYENWTDVSGLLAADPRIVDAPRSVDFISYRELRILSYMGASVLHTDAVYPVQRVGIPINIRNTNRPDDPGTMIVYALNEKQKVHAITGVTGRKGLSIVQVEKAMVSDGSGYSAVLLDIFKRHAVPFESCITGIDTITVAVRSDLFSADKAAIIGEIREQLAPDTLIVRENLSMIAVVGEKTEALKNVTVRILSAVAAAGIEIITINQGAGALNLIISVAESDYAATVNAIYRGMENA